MSRQQESRLRALLQRLVRAQGVQKDPDAERLVTKAFERQPDAAYLLAQRVLVLEAALEESREQMARVQSTPFAPGLPASDERPRRLSRLKHAAAAGVAAGAFLCQGVEDPGSGVRPGGGLNPAPEAVIELSLDTDGSRSPDRGRQATGEALVYFDGYRVADEDEGDRST